MLERVSIALAGRGTIFLSYPVRRISRRTKLLFRVDESLIERVAFLSVLNIRVSTVFAKIIRKVNRRQFF